MVVKNVNIPTSTGRASWFVWVWFHLGGGHTNLHELSVRSVKKESIPLIHEEEQEVPEEHETPDAVPIYKRLRVYTIAVQMDNDESGSHASITRLSVKLKVTARKRSLEIIRFHTYIYFIGHVCGI